jgi:hypothetical protein
METADEILTIARRSKPHVRYAKNANETCIGAWDSYSRCWVVVACVGIDGRWHPMTLNVLVNGEKMVRDADWIL